MQMILHATDTFTAKVEASGAEKCEISVGGGGCGCAADKKKADMKRAHE